MTPALWLAAGVVAGLGAVCGARWYVGRVASREYARGWEHGAALVRASRRVAAEDAAAERAAIADALREHGTAGWFGTLGGRPVVSGDKEWAA